MRKCHLKQKVEKENELKKITTSKDADLADIKNKMQNNPGYHTLEYIEDKLGKKTGIIPGTHVESYQRRVDVLLKNHQRKPRRRILIMNRNNTSGESVDHQKTGSLSKRSRSDDWPINNKQ